MIHYIRSNQFSVPVINPATERSAINTDKFARLYDVLVRQMYAISGNQVTKVQDMVQVGANRTMFNNDQTLAMFATNSNQNNFFSDHVNWDMAALPVF